MSMTFATWLKDVLARPNLSQRGLARHLGLDPNQVSRMTTGKRRPQIDELEKIAAYVGEWPPVLQPRRAMPAPEIVVRGAIMENIWKDVQSAAPPATSTVPGVQHSDYPVQIQYAYDVLPDSGTRHQCREYIVAVAMDYVQRPLATGDVVHVQMQRDGLVQDVLRRVVRSGADVLLAKVNQNHDLAAPVGSAVIAGLVLARTTVYQ